MTRGVDLVSFRMEVQPCKKKQAERGGQGLTLTVHSWSAIIYEGRTDERERKDCSQKIDRMGS